MDKPDLLLARDDSSGYNLAIGDPSLLFWREFWQSSGLRLQNPITSWETKYPSINANPDLVQEIKEFEEEKYEHVVIGNGAKQCLMAAIWAYQLEDRYEVRPHIPINWPSFPTLCQQVGSYWAPKGFEDGGLDLVTYPGNPIAEIPANPGKLFQIWDAVYASEAYGYDPLVYTPKHEVKVTGASKLLGLPGLRVGWLLTNNAKIANLAKQYIEYTTSGVSNFSQAYAEMAMLSTWAADWSEAQERVWETIRANCEILEVQLAKFWEHIVLPDNTGGGMFAYIQFKDPDKVAQALKAANVKFVPGTACGDPTPGTYRVSLGVPLETFSDAIKALKQELFNIDRS